METTTQTQNRFLTPRRPFTSFTNVPPPVPRKRDSKLHTEQRANHLFVPYIPHDEDESPLACKLRPRLCLQRDPPGDLSHTYEYRRDPSGDLVSRLESGPFLPTDLDTPERSSYNESELPYVYTLPPKRPLSRRSFR